MADLFNDILPSITYTKKDVLENEKDYNPYIINRALSYHIDCLAFADQMNNLYDLDKRIQYQYLMVSVRKSKRWSDKWSKPEKNDAVLAIAWYFGYSKRKAAQAEKVLSAENRSNILKLYKNMLKETSG